MRNQVGRSQPGDWHISVGDEVKAASKLLCVNLHTHTRIKTNTWHLRPRTHMLYTVNTNTNTWTHMHPQREERTVVDVPTDAERRQIAPFEGEAKSNAECDFCHCGVWL